jgi:putative acetyltransferase
MTIVEDDLTGDAIIALLHEHLTDMRSISPPESSHALDLDGLRAADITFWTLWEGDDLLGCGALKELDSQTGEIKSMRTANVHRSKGVGSKVLEHIIAEASRRQYAWLYLETGSMVEFAPARALYAKYGFQYRAPFGNYREDPNSVFMEKALKEKVVNVPAGSSS